MSAPVSGAAAGSGEQGREIDAHHVGDGSVGQRVCSLEFLVHHSEHLSSS